jgi:hypothetical protein
MFDNKRECAANFRYQLNGALLTDRKSEEEVAPATFFTENPYLARVRFHQVARSPA